MAQDGSQKLEQRQPNEAVRETDWPDIESATQRRFLAHFCHQGRGHVSLACEAANIGRRTFYHWRKDPVFMEAYREAWEIICDRAEEIVCEIANDSDDKTRLAAAKGILAKRRAEVWGDESTGGEEEPTKVIGGLDPEARDAE